MYNGRPNEGDAMKQCAICGKRPVAGRSVVHRGMLKKKGGVGRKTVLFGLPPPKKVSSFDIDYFRIAQKSISMPGNSPPT